jgi:formamidopyrimidine-DNA glycosylase
VPELPETETLARDLHRLFAGRRIEETRVVRPDVLRAVTAAQLRRRLIARSIVRVWRRAKIVVFDLDSGDRLLVQPRFTGGVVVSTDAASEVDPFTTVSLRLDAGGFHLRDVRRLGTVSLLDPSDFARYEARLGIEPLDGAFTTARLSAFLRPSRQAIKKVLMDQRRIAGIGNIYANESLWIARVDPSKAASEVPHDTVATLHDTVVKVLRDAVDARGTTFRDFRDAYGKRGGYAHRLVAYGRAGQPCRRCGTRLAMTHAIDGRSTVFCFRCQS